MNQYKIVKRISDGAFGTVYEAENLSKEANSKIPPIVAIKQVYSSSNNLVRELKILKKLPKHPNIVDIYSAFTESLTTNIVMEKGRHDLTYWIGEMYYPIPDKAIKKIAYQLLEGVSAIHEAGIIHRDLKPSNLVIRDNHHIAICDFGSAVECTKGEDY